MVHQIRRQKLPPLFELTLPMKIALLGDIAPFGRYCAHRTPGVLSEFETLRTFLSDFDIVVGNLETPFSIEDRAWGCKSAHIRAHPESLSLLKHLGITHVTLANNHIADYGRAGLRRTVSHIESSGIGWFGLGRRQERIEIQGEKIALTGYCSLNTNPSILPANAREDLNLLDVDHVIEDLGRNTADGFLTILAVHSGQEHVHMPSQEDVHFARALSRRFDYVYYGHHPHVLQGTEACCNSTIFYSLGNLIFDDVFTPRDRNRPLIALSDANKIGAIATLEVIGGKIQNWAVTPTLMSENRILVGQEVPDFDQGQFDALLKQADTDEYQLRRQQAISEFISARKSRRNLKWYLRRMNLNSMGMVLSSRRNARRHAEIFTRKLQNI